VGVVGPAEELLQVGMTPATPIPLDAALFEEMKAHVLTGDPASPRNLQPIKPSEDSLVKLGQVLFFSQTLSGGFDVACATCHLPQFGGSDGLSLSVGVVPDDPSVVGPERKVDHSRDADPQRDDGPNMHRNSMTVFNVGLMDRALLFDGRVFSSDPDVVHGGMGQLINNPESGNLGEVFPGGGLLETMVKFPLTNPSEMRGFLYSDISNPEIFRERLAARLRGQADNDYIPVAASAKWETLFRDAFPDVPLQDLMTLEKIQIALASYIRSQIFVDNAWHDYLDALPSSVASGQENARITDAAKAGAKLFYSDISEGGAGCYQCHSGDRFTNEDFYNVGFPQIGRGFLRADRGDRGRWHSTREDDSWYSFRVPSLLNVAVTAPWGHAGTFSDLNELIRYHADPLSQIDVFDWELGHLDQFDNNGRLLYPQAEELTRQSLAHPSFSQAEQLLPGPLSESSVEALSAFLNTLTDKCVSDIGCISQWAPDASDDPDGYLLVEGDMPVPPFVDTVTPEQYPKSFALDFPVVGNGTFPELNDECGVNTVASNTGVNQFQERALSLGLTKEHGFHYETWFGGSNAQTEAVMIAGGVSAAYLDNDCWPDLIFSGGMSRGLSFIRTRRVTLSHNRSFLKSHLIMRVLPGLLMQI